MNNRLQANQPAPRTTGSILDSIRQWFFPAEFRIAPPSAALNIATPAGDGPASHGDEAEQQSEAPPDSRASNQFVAELATCLWYLKTKHFKRAWDDDGTGDNGGDDGPRVRRAIGRLNRGIDILKDNGIEIDDPTNKRYPQGGEGMMRPLQFQPTAGLTFEQVTETVIPIVYRDDQLIQRGEVFVAVPNEDATTGYQPTADTEVPETPGKAHFEGKPDEDVQMDERVAANQDNASDAVEAASESVEAPHDVTKTEQDGDADVQKPAPENNN